MTGPRSDWLSRVEVDGQRVIAESPVYIVLHKPRGVVSTMQDPQGRPSVRELFTGVSARVFPVGRLDFNTSGVLLATNDGDFAEGLTHTRRAAPKKYVVKVHGEMKPEDLDAWRGGVALEDGETLPAKVKLLRYEGGKTWLELTITEGRNQQVRRMGEATGFRVMRLARLAFAGITSEGLRPGEWRYLTADELATMKKEHGVPKRIVSPPPPAAARRRVPEKPAADARSRDRQPRYGGGAPARQAPAARPDWGGGVRRGSSGERDEDRAPQGERQGGRGGRTRTTGTGGGIGAQEGGNYRVRGRRGWAG
ncbi:MAG TPA: pseudouridine synthase [Polyangiaceae bacterium]|nr:pseudouridine synthase [Polyangiaceae bacterium]